MNADSTKQEQTNPPQDATGWDPYEVWRTRVLVPRLEAAGARLEPHCETPSGELATEAA